MTSPPILTPACKTQVHEIVMKNREVIDAEVTHERDFSFDFFGFKVSEGVGMGGGGVRVRESKGMGE